MAGSWQNFAVVSATLVFFQGCPPVPVPRRATPVNPPEPAEKQDAEKPDTNTLTIQKRAREKELRETMEQLFARVGNLKAELEHTSTANVFSVSIFKQTQEIEKLAKRLKNCAKG
jgi:hypothetical protein